MPSRFRGFLRGRRAAGLDRAVLAVLTIAGLALRVPGIALQPLQWDEGWSIALGRLGVGDALRLTALDVHPPLYYLALRGWLAAAGATPFALRALSALVGALAVPLAAAAARAWWPGDGGRRWVGWVAALATALSPPLVYYCGVGRMYAPAAVGVLAAAWGLAARPGRRSMGVAVAGAAGALLSFYYAGFALAGLGIAMLVARPRAWRRWAGWVGATAAVCAPWLAYALPLLLHRMSDRSGTGDAPGASIAALMLEGWKAALFVNTGGATTAIVVAAALAIALGAAVVLGARRGDSGPAAGRLLATALPILLVCAAVAVGARAHMFAPRYATVATPFAALAVAWAAGGAGAYGAGARGRLGARRGVDGRRNPPWTRAPAAIALLVMIGPTLSGAIYARSAEWFGAYDPRAVYRAVLRSSSEGETRPWDVLAFNILSQAGAYDGAAAADPSSAASGPSWTYAQLWDPVHEPVKTAIRRVEGAYEHALRGEAPGTVDPGSARWRAFARTPGVAALWLVLYKGTAASDTAALKAWADGEYFPVGGRWVDDTLLAGYIDAPTDATRRFEPAQIVGDGIELRQARYTSRAPALGNVAVTLKWRATRTVERDARVVVRLVDADGVTVARRDAVPVVASRPTTSWAAGESIEDRHGLRLPAAAHGRLRLVVSLADVATGAADRDVELGTVEVAPR